MPIYTFVHAVSLRAAPQAVLDYRIRSPEHKWRCTYKALQVLEFLLKRGSPACLTAAAELVVPLAALANFQYVGPDGRDYGLNVRLRCGPRRVG
mgnify:CR=1 FL=1